MWRARTEYFIAGEESPALTALEEQQWGLTQLHIPKEREAHTLSQRTGVKNRKGISMQLKTILKYVKICIIFPLLQIHLEIQEEQLYQ